MAAKPKTGDDTEAGRQIERGPNTAEGTTSTHLTEPDMPPGIGTPRGHGTKAQAPREGSPADTRLTHQTERHTQTPATQTERAAPRQTTPTGQKPAT